MSSLQRGPAQSPRRTFAPGVSALAVLGAGRFGTALARQAFHSGVAVTLGTRRPPADVRGAGGVPPGVTVLPVAHAVAAAEVILLALPYDRARALTSADLSGRVVVDAMNRWAAGPVVTAGATPSSSEGVAALLQGAIVVKTLNHLAYRDVENDARPAGTLDRRAVAVAGDDCAARQEIMGMVDLLGFDAVDAGHLRTGRAFEPGTAIFDGRHDAPTMHALLHHHRRSNLEEVCLPGGLVD